MSSNFTSMTYGIPRLPGPLQYDFLIYYYFCKLTFTMSLAAILSCSNGLCACRYSRMGIPSLSSRRFEFKPPQISIKSHSLSPKSRQRFLTFSMLLLCRLYFSFVHLNSSKTSNLCQHLSRLPNFINLAHARPPFLVQN